MTKSQLLVESCACTRLRTAARLITRAYDEALRPSGINASQLAILAAIDVGDATSIVTLAKRLDVDRTTLSRNLKPLEKMNLIRLGPEGWKRSKTMHVTAEGQRRLATAAGLWEHAQAGFLDRFGKAQWKRVETDLKAIAAHY